MIDGFVGAPYRPQGLAASLRQAQAGPGLAGAEGSAARGARSGSKTPYGKSEERKQELFELLKIVFKALSFSTSLIATFSFVWVWPSLSSKIIPFPLNL